MEFYLYANIALSIRRGQADVRAMKPPGDIDLVMPSSKDGGTSIFKRFNYSDQKVTYPHYCSKIGICLSFCFVSRKHARRAAGHWATGSVAATCL
jgi:hypothetical protein